jgi:hypothetical protein
LAGICYNSVASSLVAITSILPKTAISEAELYGDKGEKCFEEREELYMY